MKKLYYSSTMETLDAWIGGFLKLVRKFDIGKYRICIWKLPERGPFDEMLEPAKPMQSSINRRFKSQEKTKE